MKKNKYLEISFFEQFKFTRWIVGKCLKHDTDNIIDIDPESITDSLGKHMDQIQKTIRWIYALALLFIISPDIKMFGLDNKDGTLNFFYIAATFLIFVHLSLFLCFMRIGKLIQHLNETNFIPGLSKLSTHTLIPNPFVLVGTISYKETEAKIFFCFAIFFWGFIPFFSLLRIANLTDPNLLLKYFILITYTIILGLPLYLIEGIRRIIISKLNKYYKNQSSSDNNQ